MTDPFLEFARSGIRPGLTRIRRLLSLLDHPERNYLCVLVAGSNGKGMTASTLAGILRAAGMRPGLFTSPHLVSVAERFQVAGRPVTARSLRGFLSSYGTECRSLGATYFEVTTACALKLFSEHDVDIAVLEIGLGGRWDACNAVTPALSVITSISREHTSYLGSRLAEIAVEKAQVVRRGHPVVVGPLGPAARRATLAELKRKGAQPLVYGRDFHVEDLELGPRGAKWTLLDRGDRMHLRTRQLGTPAAINASLAAVSARSLLALASLHPPGPSWQHVRTAIREHLWPGRLQVVARRPLTVLDVAHNAAAIRALVDDWARIWSGRRPVIITALLGDKPAAAIARELSRISDHIVVTRADSPRSRDPQVLQRLWRRRFDRVQASPTVGEALELALSAAGSRGSVLVCGSHFLVGPAMAALGVEPWGSAG